MFNTFANMSRKEDKYGEVHLISLFAATLSRMNYMNDTRFLGAYNSIMGPVFLDKMLASFNNAVVKANQQKSPAILNNLLLNDQELFGLSAWPEIQQFTYLFNGKKYIDFLKLNMPQNINVITGELGGNLSFPLKNVVAGPSANVKYISIAWSNYGEVYVVADKRMPNIVMVCWRGTYSAKTAGLYSKPTSVVPLETCKDANGNKESFLYGMFKPTVEMIHTIIESITFLATDFLKATQPKSVTIFTTGHSLGGAMCSNFAYLWMGIAKTAPYNAAPYNIFTDNIICISLGAPRCMGSSVAQKFCKFVENNQIFYLRITTRGDPVTGLPPKMGFEHPCSTNEEMRKKISEDCNDHLRMRPMPNVDYAKNLDCQNYKTRAYIPNMLSHTIYLYIKFTGAVDIINFLKGMGVQKEIARTADGSTVCRLIVGEVANSQLQFKTPIFFNVNQARLIPSATDKNEEAQAATELPDLGDVATVPAPAPAAVPTRQMGGIGFSMPTAPKIKLGGEVAEDVRISRKVFTDMMNAMTPFGLPVENLNMLSGQMFAINSPITMPKLDCPSLTFAKGGKRLKRSKRVRRSRVRRSTRKSTPKQVRAKRHTRRRF